MSQSRITRLFDRLRTDSRPALIAYIVAGDPSPSATPDLVSALQRGHQLDHPERVQAEVAQWHIRSERRVGRKKWQVTTEQFLELPVPRGHFGPLL